MRTYLYVHIYISIPWGCGSCKWYVVEGCECKINGISGHVSTIFRICSSRKCLWFALLHEPFRWALAKPNSCSAKASTSYKSHLHRAKAANRRTIARAASITNGMLVLTCRVTLWMCLHCVTCGCWRRVQRFPSDATFVRRSASLQTEPAVLGKTKRDTVGQSEQPDRDTTVSAGGQQFFE